MLHLAANKFNRRPRVNLFRSRKFFNKTSNYTCSLCKRRLINSITQSQRMERTGGGSSLTFAHKICQEQVAHKFLIWLESHRSAPQMEISFPRCAKKRWKMEGAGSGACTFSRSPNELCIYANERRIVERSRATRRGSRRPALPHRQQPDEREIKYITNTPHHNTMDAHSHNSKHIQQNCPAASILQCNEPLSKTWAIFDANRAPRSISLTFTLSRCTWSNQYCQKISFKSLQIKF